MGFSCEKSFKKRAFLNGGNLCREVESGVRVYSWNSMPGTKDMGGHKRTRGDMTAPLREWFAIRCAWIVECLPAIRQSFLHRVHRSEAEMAHVNLQNASVREHTEPKSVQNNDRH